MKRARKRAKAQEAKQKSPKRLRLLSKKKSESDKIEQAMTGDEQMAIDMYEATQEKRRKVTVIDSQLMFEVTNGPILCKYLAVIALYFSIFPIYTVFHDTRIFRMGPDDIWLCFGNVNTTEFGR